MIRIQRKEFISNISSTTAFNIQKFTLNPGTNQLFPWLSQVAVNYEQYKFNDVGFVYRSTSSESTNTTNTALGTILFVANTDPIDVAFTSKFEMANYYGCKTSKLSDDMAYAIPINSDRMLYVRTGIQPNSTDLRLYDLASLYIATDGAQGANTVGELYVVYDIELYYPKLSSGLGYNSGAIQGINAGASNAAFTGTLGGLVCRSNTDAKLVQSTVNQLILRKAIGFEHFILRVLWIGTAAACSVPTLGLVNCTYNGNGLLSGATTTTNYTGAITNPSAACYIEWYLSVTDRDADVTINFAGGVVPTNSTVNIWIDEQAPTQTAANSNTYFASTV